VLADGKIVVVGDVSLPGGGRTGVARFLANGTPDASFGINGTAAPSTGTSLDAFALAVQADGKVLAAGRSGSDFGVARYIAQSWTKVDLSGGNLVITDIFTGGKADRLRLSYVGGKIRIQDLNGNSITTSVGVGSETSLVEVDPALFSGKIIVNALAGSDKLILDPSLAALGKNLDFNGGGDANALWMQGNGGGGTALYSPSNTTLFSGSVVVNGATTTSVTSTAFVDLSGFGVATLAMPAVAGNQTAVLAGFDAISGATAALTVFNANTFTTTHLFNNGTAVVDATALGGANALAVASNPGLASGNTNVTLRTSAHANSFITFDSALTVAGALEIATPAINLRNLLTAGSIIASAATVNVAGAGWIQQGITLAAAVAAVNVAP
jgi:hypothetical protein